MNLHTIRSIVVYIAKFPVRLSLAAAHILVVVAVGWFVLRFYPGDQWTPVRLANYFTPWLIFGLLLSLLIAFATRQRWLLAISFVIMLGLNGPLRPVLTSYSGQAQAKPEVKNSTMSLRVMTYNVNFKNRNAAGVADMIRHELPDVIAFQEMTYDLLDMLQAELKTDYPHTLVDDSWALPLVLMSRYPLEPQAKPVDAVRAQHAAVETPNGTIVLWNLHPNPAVLKGWESQRKLIATVAQEISRETRPLIVVGDFNATDQSDNYFLIADHLTDVHRSAGDGFDFTFPDFEAAIAADQPWYMRLALQVPPLIRIDHVFVSDHFTPQAYEVLPHSLGSDHRPVLATMQLDES